MSLPFGTPKELADVGESMLPQIPADEYAWRNRYW